MHCKGKCYLAKQLKEQQKEEQSPVAKKDKSEAQWYLSVQTYCFTPDKYYFKRKYQKLNDIRLEIFPRSVFHPPAA